MSAGKDLLQTFEEEDEHGESEGDELWLISYADMMTLLFGFFVILYSLSNIDDKKFEQMSAKMAKAFSAPDQKVHDEQLSEEARQLRAFHMMLAMLNVNDSATALKAIERATADQKTAESVTKVIQDKLQRTNPDLIAAATGQADRDTIVELILPESALFNQGSSMLTPAALQRVRKIAGELRLINDLVEIEVVGHTNAPLPGKATSYRDTFALSSVRAGAVAEALIASGIDPHKISVRGQGGLMPLAPEVDAEGRPILVNRARNRRVEILLRKRPSHE